MALFSNIGSGDLATMQAQLDEQRATEVANLTPNQIYQQMAYKAGSGLTRGIGGLLGADMVDPELKRRSERARIVGEINPEDEASLAQGIKNLQQAGFAEDAFALSARLLERQKKKAEIASEQALAAQRGREKQAADPFQKLVEQGIYTPESLAKYKESGLVTDLQRYEKPTIESKSEFERILSDLNLSPTQEKQIKQQWIQAKLNPDGSGLKSLQAQLLQTQIEQRQAKLEADREKSATEKTQAVSKLSSTESSIDTALNTAEKALKLAPNSLAGGLNQAVSSAIPWTNSKALANLVSSLNSEKAIGTLEELKSQSRTGATGFGALSEKELALIINKTRALDPTDKLFKENLGVVMDGWSKVRKQIRESRLNLQGKKEETEDTKPMYATNPTTKQRIMSTDGGKTWTQAR